jgi:hypothetical protein
MWLVMSPGNAIGKCRLADADVDVDVDGGGGGGVDGTEGDGVDDIGFDRVTDAVAETDPGVVSATDPGDASSPAPVPAPAAFRRVRRRRLLACWRIFFFSSLVSRVCVCVCCRTLRFRKFFLIFGRMRDRRPSTDVRELKKN